MKSICLHSKKDIGEMLRENIYLHIYSIGDLDNFFWPYTIWYALKDDTGINAIVLLYIGQPVPTLLALTEKPAHMCKLLTSISHLLPARFYAHLSPGVGSALSPGYNLEPHGEYLKMALLNNSAVANYSVSGISNLGSEDAGEIIEFYKESYPENWFDPRMLETKQYFGIREKGRLASVSGIHVYSSEYKVAALGNIATAPLYRNNGYAGKVAAKTCQSLLETVNHIGLNVKADNNIAISCYKKLGFEIVASYDEYMVQRK